MEQPTDELVTIPVRVLLEILPYVKDTKYEQSIQSILHHRRVTENQQNLSLPKQAKVIRIVDGDTVVLENEVILRYVGITAPETGEPFEKESTEENRRLVEGKIIQLEYDKYTGDKFGRILAYAIVDGKNVSIELARKGLAEIVLYQKRKPFIYQEKLLKAQEEAKREKRGIWNRDKNPQ